MARKKVAEDWVPTLLFLIFWATLSPVAHGTVAEGDALVTMMTSWGVMFPGWIRGVDPCASGQDWLHVQCRGPSVVSLNVTHAGVQGKLPEEIGELTNLEVLDIGNFDGEPDNTTHPVGYELLFNNMTGPFPNTLAKCTQLRVLNGTNVQWNMSFPSVVTNITALRAFALANANIKGLIPKEFFGLTNLTEVWIGSNEDLKADLMDFVNLKNLVVLAMSKKNYAQQIPDELGTLTNLKYFNCHTCSLYGPLPDGFKNLTKLENLTMHRNEFTGQFPESWRSMKAMKNLRVDENYISGLFPEWVLRELPALDTLRLEKNRFYGPAPNLVDLDRQYNLSARFIQMKWSCNYLNGTDTCAPGSCAGGSELLTEKVTDDSKSPFDFDTNCYSNTSPNDFSKVATDCDEYHPKDLLCEGFQAYIAEQDGCLICPTGQVPWPEAGKCVCQPGEEDPSSGGSHGISAGAVAGIVVGVGAVFLVIIAFILYKRRKQFAFLDIFTIHKEKESEDWEIPPGVERFSLQDLARVTQDFSDTNMIGHGGFGKVFVGTLGDGRMVAIKRATVGGLQGDKEFRNEVSLLSRLHHRHLVKLEGFCDEEGLQILVYEFMKKGNLHDHLLGKRTTTPLDWYRRLEIAYGVAQGLEYLHSFANPPVIHRDVKPSNILLDDHMVAKLADFGISKANPESDTHLSTRPAGTAGYLDPDYFMRRQLTTASDVYAFGVVLLELITGQEAIDHTRHEEFNLMEWVKKRFKTRGIIAIVDPLIEDNYDSAAFTEMAKLGLTCATFDRSQRPNMQEVLATLQPFMLRTTPSHDDSKKHRTAPLETDYNPHHTLLSSGTPRSTASDYTNRSNLSEVGSNDAMMSRNLAPR